MYKYYPIKFIIKEIVKGLLLVHMLKNATKN
jgi:hypothetical protein